MSQLRVSVGIVLAAALASNFCNGAEPRITAKVVPGGVTEIVIAPSGGKPLTYRLDLSRHRAPARERTPALAAWEAYRFGAFVRFNSNQFSGSEHCHTRDPKLYNPTALDVPGWIAAFKQAGMKYAVLTARHTSNFLLWDSATTTCDVASSGNPTDVVGAFVEGCRKQGIAPGLYYCMWGTKGANPHPNARAIILAQLYELATRYGEISCFWIDMMRWAPPDLSTQEVYDAIKSLQPRSIVIMNQHVQDGTRLNYFPTDVMNGELMPPPPEGHNPRRSVEGTTYYLPFEYEPCSQRREKGIAYDPLGPSCWFTYGEGMPFAPSHTFPAAAMARRIRLAYERGAANVLLATAPDHTGRMRPGDVAELVRLGRLLAQPDRSESPAKGPADAELRKRLVPYLTDLCDWIMTLDAGSGTLRNTKDTPWSIFINGNLARVLAAGSQITGNPAYLREALRWCDTFVGQQQPAVTARGQSAGYWADAGPKGNIYLADAGTAATALAVISRHADPARQKTYRQALERFSRFVRQGCLEDPQAQGRGGSDGWVIGDGQNRGALGCGYYRGHLSRAPYIISSGTNGGAFHALLYSIAKDPELAEVSTGAVRWILSRREPGGELAYIIDDQPPAFHLPMCTMTYVGDGLVAAYTHLDDADLRRHVAWQVKPCVEWLLKSQNADGTWGKPNSFDRQRSPGVVTMLAWYYRAVDPDPRIAQAVAKYCRFLFQPESTKEYGVKRLVRTSGFVGLVVADLIRPGVTF